MWVDKADSKVSAIKNPSFLRRYYAVLGKYYACIEKPKLSAIAIQNTLTYSDSFYFERREIEANKIEATYQTKIKTDSINFLSLQNEKQNVEISRRNIGLGTTSIILLLLGFLARYYVKLSEKQKQLNSFLESKNEELVFQNSELQRVNQQLEAKTVSLATHTTEEETPSELKVKSSDKVFMIAMDSITHIQAENDGTRIYYDNTSKWTDASFKKMKGQVPNDLFIQIFRSTVVNINHIGWINTTTLKLKDDTVLKIGRTYKERIKEAIKS